MHRPSSIGRRQLLKAGGAVGLAAATAQLLTAPAQATATADGPCTRITDLGPGIEQFALMSALQVGDTVYIGSRNLEPTRVIAFHLPTRKVVSQTVLGVGHSVQALAADSTGRYLYAGILTKGDEGKPNIFRWDLTTPDKPAVGVGRTEDRDIRDLAVAPDGTVYAVGGIPGKAPALWMYDPGTGAVTNLGIPDPKATLARAVAATDTAVFFGAGSVLAGGDGASKASLYAYDRAARTFTNVTPPEMEKDPSLRDLAVFGGRLAVSTSGSTEPAKLAVMDLADLSSYTVTPTTGKVVKNLAAHGDLIHFATDAGLHSYSTVSKVVAPVAFDGDLGEIWGLDHAGGKLTVVSGYGFVAEIDTSAGTSVVTDLGQAGAPVTPQTTMGIAADHRFVYVGGNNGIARHDLRNGKVVNLRAPGEAKDAQVLDGVLYTGQYSSQGMWTYDPTRDEQPHQLAAFPSEQNRPLDVCHDPVNELLLVGAQSDTEGGGSLWTYSTKTGKKAAYINPVDATQLVRAVATREGVAFLGGDNPTTQGPRGTIVAFDPVAGRELWRIDLPATLTTGTAALAVHGKHLYGLTRKGGFFVVDVTIRRVIHTADHRALCPGFAAMVTSRGIVYGVSDTTLFRFDPKTFAVSTVVPEINGAWYSGPHVNADSRGLLYTMRGHHLVRVEDRPVI
ncbi:PQQ-binding-like beta-propeller repeat protein [Streptomyces sp. NBC_00094]|uniref:outer membrane protein assembly factor BamB family protein n=1 Tax=Streptomyces sp. NBC_00094 TaxID=2903620 RepID=UPI002258834D|nr:PQQ-binding-like beta-propeller repeat protein [Streptomyces sp. NBC_00094]MCX5394336.1 PQQ-binding-like beta-propeller repeat protein [Streptomyces sp. NBC_00094]